ncbi:acetylxylan esterase [Octadecabacter sp. 1_MG-2023]|uniref:alpha/beta hydrolase family protein n=1 Tax=unclassified Octadecabacter TaxID=196158 RepID=UPI001C09E82C|nr:MULTISPECIES: acetylxylan esterase [unclassified Octadecabacter]MBU2994386.1 acetylxylan esterase [Octadecabacter sp. B2R22]MDO6734323.1 acetylxylan esterase [Octadecabacter sp. 1_MG-2023]
MNWQDDQKGLRDRLFQLLGVDAGGASFAGVQSRGVQDCHGWCLEDLLFQGANGEDIPAFFLRPPRGHAKVPALIYAHAHGNNYAVGRDELIAGRPALQGPYAADLVARGVAVLCIEMPCFGARQQPNESSRSKALAWHGKTLFGQMLDEQRAGIEFLSQHSAVDADRIGTLGFSMGSTLAWWLAALDPRIRATSALCSFADLETLVGTGAHDGHGPYMTVPGLLPVARSGQIAGLAAPRALHIGGGLLDWSTPAVAFEIGRSDLEAGYAAAGAQEKLSFFVDPQSGHVETPEMRAAALDFLRRELLD